MYLGILYVRLTKRTSSSFSNSCSYYFYSASLSTFTFWNHVHCQPSSSSFFWLPPKVFRKWWFRWNIMSSSYLTSARAGRHFFLLLLTKFSSLVCAKASFVILFNSYETMADETNQSLIFPFTKGFGIFMNYLSPNPSSPRVSLSSYFVYVVFLSSHLLKEQINFLSYPHRLKPTT